MNIHHGRVRNQHEPVGRDGVDPATKSVPGEMTRADVRLEIVETGVARAEEEHVLTRCDHAAVMSWPYETPGFLLTSQEIRTRLLFTGLQVEPPRFGEYTTPDDDGAVPIVGILGPELVSIIGR